MKEEKVTPETIKLLKDRNYPYFFSDGKNTWQATQSLVQRWLREKHGIKLFVTFETIDSSEVAWVWNIMKDLAENEAGKRPSEWYERLDSFSNMMWYNTYEEALKEGLQTALKLLL